MNSANEVLRERLRFKSGAKKYITYMSWQSPDLFWPEMEAETYTAATGIPMTEKELDEAAERSRLLFRAILIRNFGRDRDMEVNAVFPTMQYPDPWGGDSHLGGLERPC
jgi:aldehyde:ferredoxin oxidoreductase